MVQGCTEFLECLHASVVEVECVVLTGELGEWGCNSFVIANKALVEVAKA